MPPALIPSDWPNRSASVQIACKPHLWHVQDIGPKSDPVLLLIHGAGGSTHSFRHLIPLLATDYRLIVIDLPGQGFTRLGARSRCGVDGMASDIAALCTAQDWPIAAIIGHSAGAAIALRLAEMTPVQAVIGINAALGKFEGASGWIFPLMARLLAITPMVAQIFSKVAATPKQVRNLLASTGSKIDPVGEAQYLHLMRMPTHVGATLAMMSQWNLDALVNRLPRQTTPTLLITAANDLAVPPSVSQKAAQRMPQARAVYVPGYGHLIHEEAAEQVSPLVRGFLAEWVKAQV
jgi:magnesium chelatase accessory protein